MIKIKKVSCEELEKVSGGALEWVGIGLAASGLIVFLSGIIEGYTNPGRCSN